MHDVKQDNLGLAVDINYSYLCGGTTLSIRMIWLVKFVIFIPNSGTPSIVGTESCDTPILWVKFRGMGMTGEDHPG